MAGFLNEQVQEWYEKNKDLLSVIDKLTKRCEKLEEENNYNKKRLEEKDITIKNLSWKADGLRHDKELLKNEFDIKVKVVKELNDRLESLDRNFRLSKSTITYLNGCLAEKKARNRELKQKLDAITDSSNVALNSIFTSLGVNDTRSALDKIMEMKKLIKQNEEEKQNLKDEVKTAVSREEVTKKNLEWRTHEVTDLNNCLAQKNARIKELRREIDSLLQNLEVNTVEQGIEMIRALKDGHISVKYEYDIHTSTERELRKKVGELQESYDNCVNECADHINEINSLLQNLEVKTVEQGIEAIKALKDGWMIKFDFSAEADLRMENEKLKKKVEDLRKDIKFEFDHRMEALAASADQKAKIAELKEENARLKNFIKDRTNDIHEMSEEIEKRLAKYRKEEEDHEL